MQSCLTKYEICLWCVEMQLCTGKRTIKIQVAISAKAIDVWVDARNVKIVSGLHVIEMKSTRIELLLLQKTAMNWRST